jgi:hypothetical protein
VISVITKLRGGNSVIREIAARSSGAPFRRCSQTNIGFGKPCAHGDLPRPVAFVGLPDLQCSSVVAISTATILITEISQEYLK